MESPDTLMDMDVCRHSRDLQAIVTSYSSSILVYIPYRCGSDVPLVRFLYEKLRPLCKWLYRLPYIAAEPFK